MVTNEFFKLLLLQKVAYRQLMVSGKQKRGRKCKHKHRDCKRIENPTSLDEGKIDIDKPNQ